MKDYYYILGTSKEATSDEIKKAYRKLSLKFHPDKNEGDDFFTERFKEVQEAYEVLIDPYKRSQFDINFNRNQRYSETAYNFQPHIEFFSVDKDYFEYDKSITFSWRTINADKVVLKPFGEIEPIGNKTYKIKDIKNEYLTFELSATNSVIDKVVKSSINILNKTYQEFDQEIRKKIVREHELKSKNFRSDTDNKKDSIHKYSAPSFKTNSVSNEYSFMKGTLEVSQIEFCDGIIGKIYKK